MKTVTGPLCGVLSLILAAATACQASGVSSAEPQVQRVMGTQTGGSTEQPYCGPEAWEQVDETAPFASVYVGAVELQGWRLACEKECRQACATNCSRDCSRTDAPVGNAKEATLSVEVTGSVERRVLPDEQVNESCASERRTTVRWELEVDESFVAGGSEALAYTAEGVGFVWTIENSTLDHEETLIVPSPGDFADLGAELSDDAEVSLSGMLSLAGGEAGIELTFTCKGCSNGRVAMPLAAGVLHDEGRPHTPPVEETRSPVSWHWEQAECVAPGSGGTPNLPASDGGFGGTDF
jgi:hypothetical protein